MEFSYWVQKQLEKRQWEQKELLEHMAEYQISQGQLSRIIKGTRQAGPEACIAIAHALDIPREDVFIARGWLLPRPLNFSGPPIDPRAEQIARDVSSLPPTTRYLAFEVIEPVLNSIQRLSTQIEGALPSSTKTPPVGIAELQDK